MNKSAKILAQRIRQGNLPVAYSIFHKKDVVDISPTITTMSAQFIDKKTSIVVFEVTENGK